MDAFGRNALRTAALLVLFALLFPPFRLGNGQPRWAFIGTPPQVCHWVVWDEVLANNFQTAGIHWGFLVMEVAVIAVMAISVWVSLNGGHHPRGHR